MSLPTGWASAPIGDICDLSNGMAFKPTDWAKSGLPIIRIQNLNRPDAEFNYCRKAVDERFLVEPGELLFAWSGTPGTSFGAHIWNGPRAVLNQHIFRVRHSESDIDRAFFKRAINAKLEELIGKAHGGVGLRHVTKGKFEGTEIRLPPQAEQRRIVAKLDALTARLARARAELDRVPVMAEKLRDSALQQAFTLSAPETCIADIAGRVTKGSSPGWQGYEYQSDGVLFVRSQNVRWGRLALDDQVYLPSAFNEKARNSVIRTGDVLLNIVGASIGRAAIATPALDGANCNQAVCIIRPVDAEDADYLMFYLVSPRAQAAITDGAVDVARANFSLAQVKALSLPWPIADVRRSIVEKVERAFARADRLEAEATRARALLDRLESALLAKAFRGELVPQDPNDEPAQTLLDRIRTQRAAAPKAKRGRKAKVAA